MSGQAVYYPGCSLLLGDELEWVEQGYLVIEGGRIVECGPGEPRYGSPALRLDGTVVLPALINAHTHLGDAGAAEAAAGKGLEEAVIGPHSTKARWLARIDQQERVAAVRQNLLTACRLGVLRFCDFREGGVAGVSDLRTAAAGLPVGVMALGRWLDPGAVCAPGEAGSEGLTAAAVGELAELLGVADGLALATMNDLPAAAWPEALNRTRQANRVFAIHAAESATVTETAVRRTGHRDVEGALALAPLHLVHLTAASDEDLDRVAVAGTPAVVCPRSNALLGLGVPPVAGLIARGVPVGLGTDNAMLNSVNMWRELECASKLLSAVHRRPACVPPRTLLQMATIFGARALGLHQATGSLVPGKLADFVAVDLRRGSLRWARDIWAGLVHRVEPDDIAGVWFLGERVQVEGKVAGQ